MAVALLLSGGLVVQSVNAQKGAQIKSGNGKLDIIIDGVPFTTYHFGSEFRKTFFHPVCDARGVPVTRDYPLGALVEGEKADHPHHKGLWFGHQEVNGNDTWSEKTRTVHKSFNKMQIERGNVLLEEKLDWLDAADKPIIHEARTVKLRGGDGTRTIDFEATLTPAEGKVTFGDNKDGLFAIRVIDPIRADKGGKMENSAGGVGEKECWAKKADWVDFNGVVNGERVGVAILDHPASFRHPTVWHVRDYGLHSANPFLGSKMSPKTLTESGEYVLEPGKSITLKYRVFIHKGDAKEGKVAQQYAAFADAVEKAIRKKDSASSE